MRGAYKILAKMSYFSGLHYKGRKTWGIGICFVSRRQAHFHAFVFFPVFRSRCFVWWFDPSDLTWRQCGKCGKCGKGRREAECKGANFFIFFTERTQRVRSVCVAQAAKPALPAARRRVFVFSEPGEAPPRQQAWQPALRACYARAAQHQLLSDVTRPVGFTGMQKAQMRFSSILH
jgi:hypothetical protein